MNEHRWGRWLFWLAPLLGATLAVLFFSSTGHDDCHITFWAAFSLAEYGEILNYGGERLEQSSSLLHTLVLAVLYKTTTIPMAWLGYAVGIGFATLTAWRLRDLARACGWEGGLGLVLFAVTCPAFAYWQLGKLESSLFTWCAVEYLIALVASLRAEGRVTVGGWVRLGATTLALAAARPEGALVAIAVGLALVVLAFFGRGPERLHPGRAGLAAALGALALLLLIGFRLSYFGEPFPHPVMAKVGGAESFRKLQMGLAYLLDRLTSAGGGLLLAGLIAGLIVGLRDLRERRLERLAPLLFVGAYLGFISVAGGDWMACWRFVAHVEPLLGFLLFQGLTHVAWSGAALRLASAVLVTVNAFGMLRLGMHESTGRPLWSSWQTDRAVAALAGERPGYWPERANMIHGRDVMCVQPLVELLTRVVEHQGSARLLTKQGGLLAYYAARELFGSIEVVDPMGLVSGHLHEVREELSIPTDQLGLSLGIQDVLWLGKRRTEPMFHPDVVFDIGINAARYAANNGYVVVHEQTGTAHASYTTLAELTAPALEYDPEGDRPPMEGHRARMTRPLWEGEWSMYQFIALREELARELGIASVREARREAPVDAGAAPGFLDWDAARIEHLRFFGGEPTELPGIGSFSATGTALFDGRQVADPDAEDLIPGALTIRMVERVGPGGRRQLLQEDEDYSVRYQGTVRARILLKAPAGVRPGDRIEIAGTTSAPGSFTREIAFKRGSDRARDRL